MLQIDGTPHPPTPSVDVVGRALAVVQLDNFLLLFDSVGSEQNVRQVRIEHFVLEFLVEDQLEEALLVVGTLVFGFGADEPPLDLEVLELVIDLLALLDGGADVLLARGLADSEAVRGGADLGSQVELGGFVDLVAGHATALVDDEGESGGAGGK